MAKPKITKADLMRSLQIGPADVEHNALRAAMHLGIYEPRQRDRSPKARIKKAKRLG